MKINGSIFDPLRPDRSTPLDPSSNGRSGEGARPAASTPSAPKTDSVQISDSGRSLAARANAGEPDQMDPERLAELRRKVYEGAYNALDVVDQVARRILTRGDL